MTWIRNTENKKDKGTKTYQYLIDLPGDEVPGVALAMLVLWLGPAQWKNTFPRPRA